MSLYRINGQQLQLRFHVAQAKVWRSDRRFTWFIAGTQSGKTSFGPWWLEREIRRRGQGDYIAATASYDLFKLKMLPEMRAVFEQLLGIGRYWSGERIIELRDPERGEFWASRADDPMWGRIILRSANAAGGLESATARAAWMDECGHDDFTLLAWEAVQRRLALAEGRVLGTTTPYNLGWLKTQVFDPWQAGDPDHLVVQAESIVNPLFPRREFERARRTMPLWKFLMMYGGQFARPAGLIYGDFDEATHLVDPFPIPVEWPRYFGVDPGPLHTGALWIAEDPARQAYYVYREYLEGGRTTPEHCEAVRQLSARERVVRWAGGAKSEHQYRWDWAAEGIPLQEPPIAEVESGIDTIIRLLKAKQLFVFRGCDHLVDEFNTYSRELDAGGQPTERIKGKNRYHMLDALRYGVLGMLGPPPVEEGVYVYHDPVEISPL